VVHRKSAIKDWDILAQTAFYVRFLGLIMAASEQCEEESGHKQLREFHDGFTSSAAIAKQ
jgi:hypothetical protein